MCAATSPNVTRLVGQSMPSLEAPDKAAGRIEYMADLTVPGMAHAKVVRSPLPHARIVSIDASEARAMPGVVCVLTRDEVQADPDMEKVYGFVYRDAPLVAMDKVRHQGDIVAVVVADDVETAEAAAELVDVDYEELPAVMNVREALAEGCAAGARGVLPHRAGAAPHRRDERLPPRDHRLRRRRAGVRGVRLRLRGRVHRAAGAALRAGPARRHLPGGGRQDHGLDELPVALPARA